MYPQDNPVQQVNHALRFRLSFTPFLNYLKRQDERNGSSVLQTMREYVLSQFVQLFPNNELESVEKHIDNSRFTALFELITFSVLPPPTGNQSVPYAIGLPDPLQLYYYSPEFKELIAKFPSLPAQAKAYLTWPEKRLFYYRLILTKCYGIQSFTNKPIYFSFQYEIGDLIRYYQIIVDGTFLQPNVEGDLPPLQPGWIDYAEGLLTNPDELIFPLPLEQFIFEGFAFFKLLDVTQTESIRQLTNVFTRLHADSEPTIYAGFEKALRNLCNQPDIQIGLMPLVEVNGRFAHFPEFTSRSLLLAHSGWQIGALETTELEYFLGFTQGNLQPRLTNEINNDTKAPHLQILYSKGIRSFIFYPIMDGDTWLGSLEIGSIHAQALTKELLENLTPVIPLFRELLLFQRNQFQTRIEQVIKQKFTPLQSSVEWKFTEYAFNHLLAENTNLIATDVIPVRFTNVYPLYGAVDIRNSSGERNKAILKDFIQQLDAIEAILALVQQPQTAELLDQSRLWNNQLIGGIDPENESEITHFLVRVANPYLRLLGDDHTEYTDLLNDYFSRADAQTGLFNQALQTFEGSLKAINNTLRIFIEQQENNLRAQYPYYIDKYLTDGLEYTFYVGKSITAQKLEESTTLQYFRQWQLSAMVDMARLTRVLQPQLPVPLTTTQLILAHAQPVDISFRQDERRFDVEGSYSIRYEVIKKRIDKAHINGTNERLTQPGTIAFVYANNRELADWLPIVESIQMHGKLGPQVDYLSLEPLQGVLGLKALRLHVLYSE